MLFADPHHPDRAGGVFFRDPAMRFRDSQPGPRTGPLPASTPAALYFQWLDARGQIRLFRISSTRPGPGSRDWTREILPRLDEVALRRLRPQLPLPGRLRHSSSPSSSPAACTGCRWSAHVVLGGLFAILLAGMLLWRARDYRFDKKEEAAFERFSCPVFKNVPKSFVRKILFWAFAVVGLLIILTALLSMLPILPADGPAHAHPDPQVQRPGRRSWRRSSSSTSPSSRPPAHDRAPLRPSGDGDILRDPHRRGRGGLCRAGRAGRLRRDRPAGPAVQPLRHAQRDLPDQPPSAGRRHDHRRRDVSVPDPGRMGPPRKPEGRSTSTSGAGQTARTRDARRRHPAPSPRRPSSSSSGRPDTKFKGEDGRGRQSRPSTSIWAPSARASPSTRPGKS